MRSILSGLNSVPSPQWKRPAVTVRDGTQLSSMDAAEGLKTKLISVNVHHNYHTSSRENQTATKALQDLHDGLQIQKGTSIEKTARVTSDTEWLGKHRALNQVPMRIELHSGAGAANIDDLQSSV
jgi:hypothetical protein